MKPLFEQHGDYQVNRGLFETSVADAIWQGLQGSVSRGELTQGQADTILAFVPRTAAFQQAVDASITRCVEATE